MTEAYIYDVVRTPRGRGKNTGSLHAVSYTHLDVYKRQKQGLIRNYYKHVWYVFITLKL